MTLSEKTESVFNTYQIKRTKPRASLINLFTSLNCAISASDAASITKIPLPTTYRVINYLCDIGYVERVHYMNSTQAYFKPKEQ